MKPAPERPTTCGVPGALSTRVRAPMLAPTALGVKVTLTAQLEPTATGPLHVFVCAKSPLVEILVNTKGKSPMLLMVIVCGALVVPTSWLPKPRLVAESTAVGPVAVPDRLTTFGLLGALLVRVRLPLREPRSVGVKVTLIVQFAPTATAAPQLLVWAKSPLTTMPKRSLLLPVLV